MFNLNFKQKFLLRIIFILGLGAVLPLFILYFIKTQVIPLSPSGNLQAQSGSDSPASLKFNMESLTIAPEDEFVVNVLLSTGGETVTAVDALIYFDPSLLEFLGATKGTINELPYYPALGKVTEEDTLNVISISGVYFNPDTQAFTAGYRSSGSSSGLFSSLRFKAKVMGPWQNLVTTNLTFKVSPDSTTDSNIMKKDTTQDILRQVNTISLTLPLPSPSAEAIPVSSAGTEAEAGTLGGDMAIANDPKASGGKYIYPYRNGTAVYSFNIERDVDYYVWVRVSSSNHSTNSYYIYFDSRTTQYTLSPNVTNNQWEWYRARLAKGFLSKGTHTIKFSKLDPYAKLDKVIFTDDPNLRP